MRIISRKYELGLLENCQRSDKSELVCVYGRRRVGKTFLIDQTFNEQFAFRATGVEKGNKITQLKSFSRRLIEFGDTTKTIPKDWFEAFSRLESILKNPSVTKSPYGKKIVFFDEFPWFATPHSDFLEAFGEFWNRYGTSKNDLLFIICGSATSWIIGNIIENTGSLYNRVTCQIFLKPFTLKETEMFFRDRNFDWSHDQIAECYMIFGGLPFFLELLNKNESLTRNVNYLCFESHALLKNESTRLLEATLRKSSIYKEILQILSKYQYGIEKQTCFEMFDYPVGTFTRAINDLEKCGYIAQYKQPYKKGKPITLQIIDPFLLFHFQVIDKAKDNLISDYSEFRSNEGKYMNWRGHAFEVICLLHLETIKKALGISDVRTNSFPWTSQKRTNGAQIDLVIERADHITNICEIKFTNHAFSVNAEYEKTLLNKLKVFKEETSTKQSLKLVMICSEGIGGTAHTEHISKVLTLSDLFEF